MDAKGNVAKLVKTVDYREAVHYKSGGATGQRWDKGTWQNPCGSLSDVRAILTARKLERVWIHGAATLDADMVGINFIGTNKTKDSIDLNGKSVAASSVKHLYIGGSSYAIVPDVIFADNCSIDITANPIELIADYCLITTSGPLPLYYDSYLQNCYCTETEAVIAITVAGQYCITGWKGNLKVQDIITGASVTVDGVGKLRVDGTGGAVTVRGDIEVVDLSGGAVTIDDKTSYAQRSGLRDIDDGVYFDSALGVAGTTWPIGTAQYPSNSIANVITMCADRKIKKIYVSGSLTLGATMVNYRFVGLKPNTAISLNNQDVTGSFFENCTIGGSQGGTGSFFAYNCTIANVTNASFIAIGGKVTESGFRPKFLATVNLFNVVGEKGTADDAVIDFSGGQAYVYASGCYGYWTVKNMTAAGSCDIGLTDGGSVKSDVSNTSGSVTARGNCIFTAGGGGAIETDSSINAAISAIKTQTDKLAGAAPGAGSTTADWNGGTATSGEVGADLVTLGANNTKNKVLSLLMSLQNLTHGATITARMYMQINGTERQISFGGSSTLTFIAGTDPDGQPLIDGVWGIHEALRIELYSDTAADDGKSVDYDYMLEEM